MYVDGWTRLNLHFGWINIPVTIQSFLPPIFGSGKVELLTATVAHAVPKSPRGESDVSYVWGILNYSKYNQLCLWYVFFLLWN